MPDQNEIKTSMAMKVVRLTMIRSVGATWAHKGRVGAGICKEVVATPERWQKERKEQRRGCPYPIKK